MKILVILTMSIFSIFTFATSKIVNYVYGNQIRNSMLQIYDNGAVKRFERTQGGGIPTEIPMASLSSTVIESLLNQIEIASRSPLKKIKRDTSHPGTSAGQLRVFLGGKSIIIRDINWGPSGQDPRLVIFNKAVEARKIEKLVFEMVANPMDI